MDLKSMLNDVLQNNVSQTIAEKTGLSVEQVNTAIAVGLPMILAGMAKNAQAKDGAASLDSALNDHTDDPVASDPASAAVDEKQSEGGKILDHVFGANTGDVVDTVAEKAGADRKSVLSALAVLAPIAIAYLARHKKEQNLDADGVADSLQKTETPTGDMLGGLVDSVLGGLLKPKSNS